MKKSHIQGRNIVKVKQQETGLGWRAGENQNNKQTRKKTKTKKDQQNNRAVVTDDKGSGKTISATKNW